MMGDELRGNGLGTMQQKEVELKTGGNLLDRAFVSF